MKTKNTPTTKEVLENKDKTMPGAIVKSHADGEVFFWVTFPGDRAEEFDTLPEAEQYLADRRNMFKRERTK